jgi:glycosyltransferase involved in cell wall biosynthesis
MAKGMPNVQFLPNQPRSRLPVFYAAAYGCVVCLKNIPSFSTFIPSKMFEIMAAGRPVIGCVKGEAAKILENSGASVVVPSEDAEKLAGAIGALLDDPKRVNQMSAAGKSFVSQKFRHSVLAQQYLDVLQALTNKKNRPSE